MKRLFKGLFTVGALALAACSNNQFVKSVHLGATTNSHVQVSLSADLNTENITLNPISLQIYNPKNPSQFFGQIDVMSPSPSVTSVGFTLDFTQALTFVDISETTTLPNGTPIPVSGPNAKWLVLKPKGDTRSLIYLNINTDMNRAAIGYALASDKVKSGVVGNLIYKVDLTGLGGTGAGGIYNGTEPGTSGFALFADISTVFGVSAVGNLQINDATSNDVKLQIQRFMYELNQQRARIRFN